MRGGRKSNRIIQFQYKDFGTLSQYVGLKCSVDKSYNNNNNQTQNENGKRQKEKGKRKFR